VKSPTERKLRPAPDNPAATTMARVEAMLCRMPRRARGSVICSNAFSRLRRPPGGGSMPGVDDHAGLLAGEQQMTGRWQGERPGRFKVIRQLLPPGSNPDREVTVAYR
jgi:hypothetical protein